MRNAYLLFEYPEGKNQHWRPSIELENNIKKNLRSYSVTVGTGLKWFTIQ